MLIIITYNSLGICNLYIYINFHNYQHHLTNEILVNLMVALQNQWVSIICVAFLILRSQINQFFYDTSHVTIYKLVHKYITTTHKFWLNTIPCSAMNSWYVTA
jgi:hypothetical protein